VGGVLTAGGLVLALAVTLVHGNPHATALVDLGVQAGVVGVLVVGFTLVHGIHLHWHREPARLS
jgi:hypothetical protein